MDEDTIDDGSIHKSQPTKTYPFKLTSNEQTVYEIADTICYKFLSMPIQINGIEAVVSDLTVEEQIVPAECRIRLMKTTSDRYLIVIEDDVFHLMPFVVPVANEKYIYPIFADAVNYCRDLGYRELFDKNRFTEALNTNQTVKRVKYQNWWKKKRDVMKRV